uniref:Uncharacterized protein n=1 Tax=Cannabis sativa TaxID=3483 RepID=A0A803QIQ1_CANSA
MFLLTPKDSLTYAKIVEGSISFHESFAETVRCLEILEGEGVEVFGWAYGFEILGKDLVHDWVLGVEIVVKGSGVGNSDGVAPERATTSGVEVLVVVELLLGKIQRRRTCGKMIKRRKAY